MLVLWGIGIVAHSASVFVRRRVTDRMATTIAKRAQKSCIRNGQLELVTLRLPAPNVGFWARLFGGGGQRENNEEREWETFAVTLPQTADSSSFLS